MKLSKYLEFVQADFEPIKSFYMKDELNPKLWENFKLDKEVRESLLKISEDFYQKLELGVDVKDIVLCGSLCNYNWSEKYSDYDLHIIINFSEVDENYELVEKLVDYAKKVWNEQHDIKIKSYEVEIAVQDNDDLSEAIKSGRMGGVFSLKDNKWIRRPERADFEPDEKLIREKARNLMTTIDEIEEEKDEDKYEVISEKIDKAWKKIKDFRKSGLESESGEFSIGNLVFKLLRRNGYIERIMKIKKQNYDKQFK